MKFQQLISGNLSKREFSFILIPIFTFLVICWTIARALYPGYAITKNMISDQGNIYNNPVGCWFFIISTSIAGIMLIFYFIYIYRQFQPTLKFLSGFMAIVGFIGGIGLFLVGVNPQGLGGINWSIHNIGSDMAFIGLGTACGISFLIMGKRIYKKQPWLFGIRKVFPA